MARRYYVQLHDGADCLCFLQLLSECQYERMMHAATSCHTRREIIEQIEAWILDGYRLKKAECLAAVDQFMNPPVEA